MTSPAFISVAGSLYRLSAKKLKRFIQACKSCGKYKKLCHSIVGRGGNGEKAR